MKQKNEHNSNLEYVNEDVIEIAVNKFNDKYNTLNEDERDIFNVLINSDLKEKEKMFQSMKTETISLLENVNNDNITNSIDKAINKINEMVCDSTNINDNIVKLFELKKEII